MKILMLAPQPFFQPRGTPFSVLGRLYALSQMGHSIDLVTYHRGEDVQIPNVRILRIVNIPFIKNVKVGPSLAKIPMDLALFVKAFRLLAKNDYDLLHTHEEAGFMGILFKRIFGIPHLYDMHSSLPQQLHNFQFSRSRLLHGIFEMLEKSTLRSADGVITICPDLYNYVDSLKIAKNHQLIENVIDYASLFENSNGNGDHPLFHDKTLRDKVKLLYVGTFEPYQGIDLLIEGMDTVLERLPSAHFLLVGGKPDQVARYRKAVQEKGVENAVSFTGSVSPVVADRFVTFADVLLSPRISGNNTPLKIYSYLRSGKPIVATRHITHTQVLDDSVAVLTEPTPEAFAEGIIRAATDNKLKNQLVSNAKRLAEDRYSYEVYVKKLGQLLDNINTN